MDFLLLSDGIAAAEMLRLMQGHFSSPEIKAISLAKGEHAFLLPYLKNMSSQGLIFCDGFDGQAFKLCCQNAKQLERQHHFLFVSQIRFLSLFKLYGLKEVLDFAAARSLLENPCSETNVKFYEI